MIAYFKSAFLHTVLLAALCFPFTVTAQTDQQSKNESESSASGDDSAAQKPVPKAENINLQEVIPDLGPRQKEGAESESGAASSEAASSAPKSDDSSSEKKNSDEPSPAVKPEKDSTEKTETAPTTSAPSVETPEEPAVVLSKYILDVEVPPSTSTRLVWTPEEKFSGLAEQTPVLIVNGATPGKTLCLTAALHGDELNGIEMIRRVMYNLDPSKLTGTVIGVPVVNLMGFRRNSRYLPDRRDLNRYFPGNTHGSSASRIAHSLFTKIIRHCDALVDLHTGSFHRTNLIQLRADLADEKVSDLAHRFGLIAVLNGRGNYGSLRAAAVRFGIPTVTLEAGEPMRLQNDVVGEGVKAIRMLMTNMGMYGRQSIWSKSAPVYYQSFWVRVNQSGILFSKAILGQRVMPGDVLGTVTDPITNAKSDIISPHQGRILGMALDQVVMPGFAAYHIGIQTPEAILIEDGQVLDGDGDDLVTDPSQGTDGTGPKIGDDFEDE